MKIMLTEPKIFGKFSIAYLIVVAGASALQGRTIEEIYRQEQSNS
jgi:hypothetical protein